METDGEEAFEEEEHSAGGDAGGVGGGGGGGVLDVVDEDGLDGHCEGHEGDGGEELCGEVGCLVLGWGAIGVEEG